MKTLKLSLIAVLFLALVSCEDDEPTPSSADKFVGSWAYETPELSFYFDVVTESGIHNVINRKVVSNGIDESQQDKNQIQMFFDNAGNCTAIDIMSRGLVHYTVFMTGTELTDDGLIIHKMEIDVPAYNPLTLKDQLIKKIR